MKSLRPNYLAASVLLLCGGAAPRLQAGQEIAAGPQNYGPLHGTLFLELGFTDEAIAGRANLLVPLYKDPSGKNMFFLDGNWYGLGNGNENASGGLGFRHRFDDPDIIVGLNAFYDYGEYSGRGYNQFGVGLEMLSKWVDFRANGYFPEDVRRSFGRYSKTTNRSSSTTSVNTSSSSSSVIIDGGEGPDIRQTTTTTTTTTTVRGTKKRVKRTYEREEAAMPGFDLELGGLIPYLDCWMEARIYGGYAYFHDPFGDDISCFNARLEARVVPAVLLNAEYKGDSRLVDGENHWYFSAQVEIPFDLGNLLQGQSPFAGITDAFKPQGACWQPADTIADKAGKKIVVPAEQLLRNRMNEDIVRNWRPTVSRSGARKVGESTKVTRTETSTSTTSQTVTDEDIGFPDIDFR
jgi:hypothetical protein